MSLEKEALSSGENKRSRTDNSIDLNTELNKYNDQVAKLERQNYTKDTYFYTMNEVKEYFEKNPQLKSHHIEVVQNPVTHQIFIYTLPRA